MNTDIGSDKISGPVVYVIDDDNIVRSMLTDMLEESGFLTLSYSSSVKFLKEYQSASPECILCDIQMPEIGGLELLRTLKARGHYPPTIFMSGYTDVAIAEEAIKMGAIDILKKPFTGKALLEKIQIALRVPRDHLAR